MNVFFRVGQLVARCAPSSWFWFTPIVYVLEFIAGLGEKSAAV